MAHGGLRSRGGAARGSVGQAAKGKKLWGAIAAPAKKGSSGQSVVRAAMRWIWCSGVERHNRWLGTPVSERSGAWGKEEAGCRRCPDRATTGEEEGMRSAVPTRLKARAPW
jgi:hypothetical protein